jgi:2-phosphosulfolactate phosphatase
MEISIHSLLEGATRATGTVAIIDVFRAFTTAAVALANGASKIVMVGTVEEALALRDPGSGHACIGEVGGRAWRHQPPVSPLRGEAPPGFDFGNSPFEISGVDFGGKTIVQRTSAGTQGIVAAGKRAARLYAPRQSRQTRPSVPFTRAHPIRSPWSRWVTTASKSGEPEPLTRVG